MKNTFKVDSPQHRSSQTEDLVQDAPSFLGIRHVGLLARDPHRLAAFYRDVMGMELVRQTSAANGLGGTAFLARHPDQEDHDLVLVSNPAAAHTAFRVASLADLLSFYRRLKEHGTPIRNCFNHVVELAVYFEDPESHLIEVYWATGLSSFEAHVEPIDLEVPEEQLRVELDRWAAQFGAREQGAEVP
jgi:catechol 2,3-dioxygenase